MKDKDEKYIQKRFGRSDAYKPSEEYLADFENRLMSRIPATQPMTPVHATGRKVPLWRVSWAAVAVCAACLCLTVMLHHGGHSNDARQHTTSCQVEYANPFDAVTDYTMTGTDDMYAFMSDSEY